jgi:hypothetical protein
MLDPERVNFQQGKWLIEDDERHIEVMEPAVGKREIGFASILRMTQSAQTGQTGLTSLTIMSGI